MSNPIDMMFYIQPWMLFGLVPLALWFEGIPAYEEGLLGQFDYINMTKIMAGCGLAFLLELSEYLLVSHTSSLTLCIAGIFKEIITVILAVCVHGEQISPLNALGLMVCLFGIMLHVWFKTRETAVVEKCQNVIQSSSYFRQADFGLVSIFFASCVINSSLTQLFNFFSFVPDSSQ